MNKMIWVWLIGAIIFFLVIIYFVNMFYSKWWNKRLKIEGKNKKEDLNQNNTELSIYDERVRPLINPDIAIGKFNKVIIDRKEKLFKEHISGEHAKRYIRESPIQIYFFNHRDIVINSKEKYDKELFFKYLKRSLPINESFAFFPPSFVDEIKGDKYVTCKIVMELNRERRYLYFPVGYYYKTILRLGLYTSLRTARFHQEVIFGYRIHWLPERLMFDGKSFTL